MLLFGVEASPRDPHAPSAQRWRRDPSDAGRGRLSTTPAFARIDPLRRQLEHIKTVLAVLVSHARHSGAS
jgi:hypothetical protein